MDVEKQLSDVPSQSVGSSDSSSQGSSHEPSVTGPVSLPAPKNEPKYWLNPNHGFVRIQDTADKMFNVINIKLMSSLNTSTGIGPQLETVYKDSYNSSLVSAARLDRFRICATAVQSARGDGGAHLKYGWYGASVGEINKILAHGFGVERNNDAYPHGICFSSFDHPMNSFDSWTGDKDGKRHMLLCRLILGSVEVVSPFSGQENPSSDAFDNGVDELMNPKKYIIWHTKTNTHIVPEFVVSFGTSMYVTGSAMISQYLKSPYSHLIPFATLIRVLCGSLPCHKTNLVTIYNAYRMNKITRPEMVMKLRQIAGDRLLIAILKAFNEKKKNGSK